MTTVKLDVDGMHCGGCVSRVESALDAVDGVERVDVSLDRHEATVEGDGVGVPDLVAAVEDAGYGASVRT